MPEAKQQQQWPLTPTRIAIDDFPEWKEDVLMYAAHVVLREMMVNKGYDVHSHNPIPEKANAVWKENKEWIGSRKS